MVNIRLAKAHIKNYRSIRECSVDLSDCAVLFGMNDSGKSNVVNAIRLGFNNASIDKSDVYASPRYPYSEQASICVDLLFIPINAQGVQTTSFDESWGLQLGASIMVDPAGNEFFAFRTEYSYDDERQEYIRERKVITEWGPNRIATGVAIGYKTLSAFDFILLDAQRDMASDIRDRTSVWSRQISRMPLSQAAKVEIESQLALLSNKIIEESPFLQNVASDLGTATNKSSTIQISPITRSVDELYKGLDIYVSQKDSNAFPISSLGLGTRNRAVFSSMKSIINARISLATAAPYFCLVAFEEPEAHIYPNAQRKLASAFLDIGGQKIITTHSPYLLASVKLDSLMYVSIFAGETVINPLSSLALEQEELRQIQRNILSSRGDILFSDVVVLAEGETEEQGLPIFIKEYFGTEAANLGISVVGVGGKNYYPFIKLLNAIQTKWFIFSDGESATITDLRRILKKLNQTEALPELADYPNIIVLDNANNFESYLQEQGYDAEIIASINEVEAGISSEAETPYFDFFIEKHHGESLSPRSTGRSCEICGQIIKESPFRDYKSDGGQQRALKDCMKAGKTRYASTIVYTICTTCDINRKFPPKIKLLLDSINTELEI